jgi:pyruvate formate lyase activating enzyme
MMDAQWWHPLADGRVACELCPVACTLKAGQNGPCGTRGNREGRLKVLNYGRVVALGIDPIEKKPLYHFRPGSTILSTAAPGCNLHCLFCQNSEISQRVDVSTREMSPQALVDIALAQGIRAIAFTYSEPLVWYEFVVDTARAARAAGLATVIVTNGYLEPGPLAQLLPLIDAANVDLKSMDDGFYQRMCKARVAPVLASIRALHAAGVHLELTNLVIPGQNDQDRDFQALAAFVADVDPGIPLHLSAYHPSYRFEAPATPPSTLTRAAGICAEVLEYVYVGNLPLTEWSHTRCPDCGETVIARAGYSAELRLTPAGACPTCGRSIPVLLDGGQSARSLPQ